MKNKKNYKLVAVAIKSIPDESIKSRLTGLNEKQYEDFVDLFFKMYSVTDNGIQEMFEDCPETVRIVLDVLGY